MNFVTMRLFSLPLVAFFITWALIFIMLRSGAVQFAMDNPNQRSLHSVPILRTGGIAIIVGILFASLGLAAFQWLWPPLLLAVALAGVSCIDDIRGLPVLLRFTAHFGAALLCVASSLPELDPIELTAAVFFLVWMTNLYNFMDGSDGLAGGMALFGFGFYGTAAWLAGNAALTAASISVAAAAAAFLVFNFHPAKVFMGDTGSISLGFLAAALGLLGWTRGVWPVWFPGLVFSPFLVDASVTLARRLGRGDKIWQAHKEHYYQRLVRMGHGHRNTALMEYLLMIGVGGSAIWGSSLDHKTQLVLVLSWGCLYTVLGWVIDTRWKRFNEGA